MLLIAVSVSTGFVLGLRYRVFILVPAILTGTLAIIAISQQPLAQICVAVATFAVLLQMSYVVGAIFRFATTSRISANVPGEFSRARLR